jgi:hypothetical protein
MPMPKPTLESKMDTTMNVLHVVGKTDDYILAYAWVYDTGKTKKIKLISRVLVSFMFLNLI